MNYFLAIAGLVFGSTGLFTFILAMIQRHDHREELRDGMAQKLDALSVALSELSERFEESQATAKRIRILRFSYDITHGAHYDKELFDQTNHDIDEYTEYCRTHEKYVNNRARHAIENINRTYAERFMDSDMTQENE